MTLTYEQLTKKLEELREKYKKSAGTDKKIIEMRGKLLKWALENKQFKNGQGELL